MSDRLAELRRQRALLQEHLAWLDREIAATPSSPETSRPAPSSAALAPEPFRVSEKTSGVPSVVTDADAILSHYANESRSVQRDVRRGCLLYTAAAFLLLVLVVAVFYFSHRR